MKITNSWELSNYNWPIDYNNSPLKLTQKQLYNESLYIFSYRDEPYKHILGGRWNIFTEYVPSKHINTWV